MIEHWRHVQKPIFGGVPIIMHIVDKLAKRAAECRRVTAHDIPDHYLAVVAKTTIADGELMTEAVASIRELQSRLHFVRNTMAILVILVIFALLYIILR